MDAIAAWCVQRQNIHHTRAGAAARRPVTPAAVRMMDDDIWHQSLRVGIRPLHELLLTSRPPQPQPEHSRADVVMATTEPTAPLARRHGRLNVCHLLRSYASLNFIGIYREPVLGRPAARYWSKSGRIKDSPPTISFECVTALWLRVRRHLFICCCTTHKVCDVTIE